MAKRVKRKAPAPRVVFKRDRVMFVYFSHDVVEEREAFRRLAHRVVDLVVDSGRHRWMSESVANSLAYIARDNLINKVTNFVQEVRAEGKEASRG